MSVNYVALADLTEYISALNTAKIKALPFDVRGLFVYVYPYFAGEKEGNISLYARGKDYHSVVTGRLETEIEGLKKTYPGASFMPFADSSPFPEVMAAVLAGLGVLGKNRLLITPDYGSYVFIGVVATDLELENEVFPTASCLNCGKCIASCPGGALGECSFTVQKCLSDVTQRKGELSDSEIALMKKNNTLWGCDICQRVCPMNNGKEQTYISEFREDLICSLALVDIPETKRELLAKYPDRAFTWRGSTPLKRNASFLEDAEFKKQ